MSFVRFSLALSVVALMAVIAAAAHADHDRNLLWHVVHDLCVTDAKTTGLPAPCETVEISDGEARGFVILKNVMGNTQFLLVPTARITGIEDTALLTLDTTNYFAEAWKNIGVVSRQAKTALPRDSLSLAINSIPGRSQDQLHIHLECVRPGVRDALGHMAKNIGTTWQPLPDDINGRRYQAMRIYGNELGTANPFHLLAGAYWRLGSANAQSGNEPSAATVIGQHTLILFGAVFEGGRSGFILLDGEADVARGNRGDGESLQDHGCAIASKS